MRCSICSSTRRAAKPARAAEACGRSPHVLSVDVVELNPVYDVGSRSAVLAALTVWHVLRGLAQRS